MLLDVPDPEEFLKLLQFTYYDPEVLKQFEVKPTRSYEMQDKSEWSGCCC